MRRDRLFVGSLFCLGLGLVGCKGSAQVDAKSGADADVRAEGEGSEWSSGQSGAKEGEPAPQGKPIPKSGAPVATYPAFEVLADGRSVVTVQANGPVDVSEQKAEGRLIYVLKGVNVSEKVNRLPLLTQHFPTQVTSVSMEQGAGAANLIIDLREPTNATFKVTENELGSLVTVTIPRSEKYAKQAPKPDAGSGQDPDAGAGGRDGADGGGEAGEDETGEEQSRDERFSADEETEETSRRVRKSRREPKAYVERAFTLPYQTLAPDASVSARGFDTADPVVFLSSGVRYGIIDYLEIEATPHAYRLSPNGAYAYPSLGITGRFTDGVFELGLRARYFIGVDSAADEQNAGAVHAGIPMAFHLGKWGRIDTGGFATFDIGAETNGLYQRLASPVYVDPGVPFRMLFQPDEAAWLGFTTGVTIEDFDDAGGTLRIPLGAEVGITASDEFNPRADLGFRFDFPQLFSPGIDGDDKVLEEAYSVALWFRWFYHI